jgi:hypothetical protein
MHSPATDVPSAGGETASRACRLCGAGTRFRFPVDLAHGLRGNYFECTACGLLQSDHLDAPGALAAAYGTPTADLDSGAAWRQFCVARHLSRLVRRAPVRQSSTLKMLDHGSGSGFLPAYFAARFGWEAVGYDPHATPFFAPARCVRDWDAVRAMAPFDLAVASEVLEHLPDPATELDRLAAVMNAERSILFVTTGLYDPRRCGRDWPYLAPEGGQHCSFYSRRALRVVADRLGATLVLRAGESGEWVFVRGRAWSGIDRLRFRAAAASVTFEVGLGTLERIG